jgi:hypothetical protein
MSDKNNKSSVENLQKWISEEIPVLQQDLQKMVRMIADITDKGTIRRIGLDKVKICQDQGLDFAIERMDTICTALDNIRAHVFKAQNKSSNLSGQMKVLRARKKLTSS